MTRRVPFVLGFCIALIAAPFFWGALINPTVNGDIIWQRLLGEQILAGHSIPAQLGTETLSAPGAPWVPQEWLLGIVLALAQHWHLYWLVALGAVGAAVSVMLISATRMRTRGAFSPFYLALGAAIVGIAMSESFGVRAQVFAWPLFGGLLWALDADDRRTWWAAPVAVAWAYIHASVMLAPVSALLYALGAAIDDRRLSPRVLRYAALVPLLALATCATPLGWRLPLYAISLVHSPIRVFIQEWQPVGTHDYALLLALAAILAGIAVVVWKRIRLSASDILLLLVFGYMATSASRNVPIFAIAAAPIVFAAVARLFPVPEQRVTHRADWVLRIVLLLTAIPAVFLLAADTLSTQYKSAYELLPVAAMDRILATRGEKRIFCYSWNMCSLALGHDDVRSFMDGRTDPFPWPVWEKYRTIMAARPQWSQTLDAYRINVVLTPDWAPLTHAIARNEEWKRMYHHDGYNIFVHRQAT